MIRLAELLLQKHARLVKFLIAGSTSTATNLTVAYVFTDVLRVYYLVSSGVAFVSSFSVSFMLQKFWTFSNPSLEIVHRQLIISLVVAGCNLGINTMLMYVFVEHFGVHYLVGQVMTSAIIACETFFVYKHVIFVSPKYHAPEETQLS